jgi:ABC-2 type transport system ATP-binding protein
VREGQCFGLLGPNGAGKSTTIEMLEGILEPTTGDIRYRGEPIGAAGGVAYRQRIGIQFQSTALQDFLTVRENLRFFGELYEKNKPLERLIEVCRLKEFLDRDASKLSGGQRQRLLLAIALVNDPEFLFLDEPTTGLDIQSRTALWDEVARLARDEGITVFLTTQYLEEADVLADRVGIIDHGKIVAEGTPAALKAQVGRPSVEIVPVDPGQVDAARLALQAFGDCSPNGTGNVTVSLPDGDAQLADVVRALDQADVKLASLELHSPTLDDVFLARTGRKLEGSGDESGDDGGD